MSKNKVTAGVIIAAIAIIIIFLLLPQTGILDINNEKGTAKTVEVMDLYTDLIPYGEMSYGDRYVSEQIFDPLVRITDTYEIVPVLANKYEINGNIISFSLSKNTFKLPDEEIEMTKSYIVDYLNILIRMYESNYVTNPGIANIYEVRETESGIEIEFNTEEPYNILALAENVGYQKDGLWYGTKAKATYFIDDASMEVVNKNEKIMYVPTSTEPGLKHDMRITNMMLGNVLANENVKNELKVNDVYGFITWGPNGTQKFTPEQRTTIFNTLETVGVRDNLTYKADSIYANTELYKNVSHPKITDLGFEIDESLTIGVVNMGSFKEIHNALQEAFNKINVPVTIETAEIGDLITGNQYDLIYVRLERGLSPDISGLLTETGLIGRTGYSQIYKEQVQEITMATTWDEMCKLLSELDKQMRIDGVWMFLDRGYDIVATPKGGE